MPPYTPVSSCSCQRDGIARQMSVAQPIRQLRPRPHVTSNRGFGLAAQLGWANPIHWCVGQSTPPGMIGPRSWVVRQGRWELKTQSNLRWSNECGGDSQSQRRSSMRRPTRPPWRKGIKTRRTTAAQKDTSDRGQEAGAVQCRGWWTRRPCPSWKWLNTRVGGAVYRDWRTK